MSHSRAEAIFEKLLEIDPTLQDNRKTAMEIIDKLLEEKPETEFDSAFAADLKAKLLSEITANTKESQNTSSESFGTKVAKFLKNRTFLTITSLAFASVAIFGAWYVYDLRT